MNLKVEKAKKNIPELRFPGFEEDWEEKRLGEVGRIVTGKTPSTADKTLWSGDVLFVTPTDILDNEKYQRRTARKVVVSDPKKILPGGSVLYTCIASIGKMSLSTAPSISNQQINALVTGEKSNNEFVYYALLNETPRIKAIQANTTLPIINKTEFSRIKIQLPSLSEQQKIAAFLTATDEWIENLKAQKGKWEEYKKGMMQKIFSREIRFRDKEGNEFPEWEEKRLGDMTTEVTKRANDGKYVLLSVTQDQGVIRRSEIEGKDNSSSDKSKYKLVKSGDVVYNTMRMWQGASGISPYDGIVSPAYTVVRLQEENDKNFFAVLFKQPRMIFDFFRFSQGLTSDTWNLKYKQFSEVRGNVPSFPEQQKIASFLTAVDEMMHAYEQKIAQAEEWKKGLMQRMFV